MDPFACCSCVPGSDTQEQCHPGQREQRTQQEEVEPAHLRHDPAGRRVDERARHRRQAREQRELRRGEARVGRARDERHVGHRAEPDAQRLERDDRRPAPAGSGAPRVREPREAQDRHHLHDTEQPQPAVDADLHHPQPAQHAADHARPQARILRDDADVGLGEAHLEVERRGERRGHAVAQLVEKDEQQDQQRMPPPRARRRTRETAAPPRRRSVFGAAAVAAGSRTTSVITRPGSRKSAVMMNTDVHGMRSARISASEPGTRLEIRYALT